MNRTSMNHGIVGDRNVISDMCRGFLLGCVYRCVILNIYFVTDFNIVYIASQNSPVPYTTIVTHLHVANNSGIFS